MATQQTQDMKNVTTLTHADLREVAGDRAATIRVIRDGLRSRSGKSWSVKGGTGTAYSWIDVDAPPARQVNGQTTDADLAELGKLLGLPGPVHQQGEAIPAGTDYRVEYMERALGRPVTKKATPYWD